jgi:hypothetical protein
MPHCKAGIILPKIPTPKGAGLAARAVSIWGKMKSGLHQGMTQADRDRL